MKNAHKLVTEPVLKLKSTGQEVYPMPGGNGVYREVLIPKPDGGATQQRVRWSNLATEREPIH